MSFKVSKSRRLRPNLDKFKVFFPLGLFESISTLPWALLGNGVFMVVGRSHSSWDFRQRCVYVKQTVFNTLFLQVMCVEPGMQVHTSSPHNNFWFCGLIVKEVYILLTKYPFRRDYKYAWRWYENNLQVKSSSKLLDFEKFSKKPTM